MFLISLLVGLFVVTPILVIFVGITNNKKSALFKASIRWGTNATPKQIFKTLENADVEIDFLGKAK